MLMIPLCFNINHTKRVSSAHQLSGPFHPVHFAGIQGRWFHYLLDIIITPQPDGIFTIGVYRKPTHKDLYLPWDNDRNLFAKYSVINTLSQRGQTICSTP